MFLILVYDVNEKRVAKYLRFVRRYLLHIQNSVFEGELTEAQYKNLKKGLKQLMNNHKEEDSVIIYIFASNKYLKREEMGKEILHSDNFII